MSNPGINSQSLETGKGRPPQLDLTTYTVLVIKLDMSSPDKYLISPCLLCLKPLVS